MFVCIQFLSFHSFPMKASLIAFQNTIKYLDSAGMTYLVSLNAFTCSRGDEVIREMPHVLGERRKVSLNLEFIKIC